MVELQILGDGGKTRLLVEKASRGLALCFPHHVLVVPESALLALDEYGVSYRELRRTGQVQREKSDAEVTIEHLERYVGKSVVQRLVQEEHITIQHFNHPKPKYRVAALILLDIGWGLTQEVADRCEELAHSDPDANVRGVAVGMLARYYMMSGNLRIADMLARFVCDEKEDPGVRKAAYWSLFTLEETPTSVLERPSILAFQFPTDVNWVYVDSFLRLRSSIARASRGIRRVFSWLPFARRLVRRPWYAAAK